MRRAALSLLIALVGSSCAARSNASPRITHGCPPNEPARNQVFHFTGPEFPDFEPQAPSSSNAVVIYGYVRAASDSSAIPRVIVDVPGTNTGTLSDSRGQYVLEASRTRGDSIRFSQVGYQVEELEIPTDSSFNRIDVELVEERYCL